MNLIHADIIKIWDPDDRNKVSCFSCPCFNCSTESVYLKQTIQDEYIPHRQRSSCDCWWRIAEVSVFTIYRDSRQIESSIALTGTDLETRSRIGFTLYIKGRGEWTVDRRRSIANRLNLTRARQESVRCVMGYIVNLIVILDGMFRTAARNTMENIAQEVMGNHIRSGRRDNIDRKSVV